MILKGLFAKLAVSAATFALGSALAVAQYGPAQYQGGYDDQHWGRGPEGYGDQYHEQQGRPMLGARQGWVAGQAQGESDRQQGHSFRPTHVDTFKHVPRSPDGYPRDQFKNEYRDAFVRGYQHGYGR